MNVILIGYRGTGKSEVGRRLAERLGRTLVSMDEEIVESAGMSIPAIVEKYGWARFRDLESVEARKLTERENLVVDTGGGVIERPENVELLRKSARVFWLKASVGTIVARIQGDDQRPALTAGRTFTEEVAEVLERRTALYRSAAHHVIETDALTPEQAAERILELLRQEGV